MRTECIHVGVGASSREDADRFYGDLLGLERTPSKTLSAEQCEALFGVSEAMETMHYVGPGADVEVFVYPSFSLPVGQVTHACMAVGERDAFVQACRAAGFTVTEFPKGDRVLVFVRDLDGNLYEVTEGGD